MIGLNQDNSIISDLLCLLPKKQDDYLGEKLRQELVAPIPVPSIYMAPKPNLFGKPMQI